MVLKCLIQLPRLLGARVLPGILGAGPCALQCRCLQCCYPFPIRFRGSGAFSADSNCANHILSKTKAGSGFSESGVVHAFGPSTMEAETGGSESEVSLLYKLTSRTDRATVESP